jgi:hypothetical protein
MTPRHQRARPHKRSGTDGFPRCRDKADSMSALVNKAFEPRNLRREPVVSPGRRSTPWPTFEDRLTAGQAPETVVASLMGAKCTARFPSPSPSPGNDTGLTKRLLRQARGQQSARLAGKAARQAHLRKGIRYSKG